MSNYTEAELSEIKSKAAAAAGVAISELTEIQQILNQANAIWESLDGQSKEDLANYHGENTSLWYCLRWGSTAVDELVAVANHSPAPQA